MMSGALPARHEIIWAWLQIADGHMYASSPHTERWLLAG